MATPRAPMLPPSKPWWLHVTFEQGRGQTGVPKVSVSYMTRTDVQPEIVTLVRTAVSAFRAQCLDPGLGHGKDLMPGEDASEYQLHNGVGGRIGTAEDIIWLTTNGETWSDVTLTWGNPSELLIRRKEP